jgi:hypothetical protein
MFKLEYALAEGDILSRIEQFLTNMCIDFLGKGIFQRRKIWIDIPDKKSYVQFLFTYLIYEQ